jgi:hypothetical protein
MVLNWEIILEIKWMQIQIYRTQILFNRNKFSLFRFMGIYLYFTPMKHLHIMYKKRKHNAQAFIQNVPGVSNLIIVASDADVILFVCPINSCAES